MNLIRELYSKKKIEFLDYISLSIDLKEGTKSIDFYVFDKLNDLKLNINNSVVSTNFIGEEGWALISLELCFTDGKPEYTVKKLELISYFSLVSFLPFNLFILYSNIESLQHSQMLLFRSK